MRVLVTRPEPGASATAARLEALGHEAILLPLTEIQPLPVGAAPDAATIDVVAITSANAARHAPDELIAALSAKPCFAVGERTADAAQRAGFSDVTSARGDAAALASLIGGEFSAGARIAYLCGRVRRPDFEAHLAERGIRVVAIETYATAPKRHSPQPVLEMLESKPVDAVLVFSAAGATALAAIALQPAVAPMLAEASYLCLSPRVAAAVQPAAASRITVSPEPTEAALIALLGVGRAA